MRHRQMAWAALLFAAFVALPASGGVKSRHLPVSTTVKQPRILTVYTRGERMFIAGQNLPTGDGIEVWLGDRFLTVLHDSATLVVAELPALPYSHVHDLRVKRGVREASLRASTATWGFVLPER